MAGGSANHIPFIQIKVIIMFTMFSLPQVVKYCAQIHSAFHVHWMSPFLLCLPLHGSRVLVCPLFSYTWNIDPDFNECCNDQKLIIGCLLNSRWDYRNPILEILTQHSLNFIHNHFSNVTTAFSVALGDTTRIASHFTPQVLLIHQGLLQLFSCCANP